MPWTNEPPLAVPQFDLAATTGDAPAPGSGSRIYAIGGGGGGHEVATVAAYDTQAKSWSAVTAMPTPRSALAAAATPGRVHALGGIGLAYDVLATHEIYQPATNAWSTAAPLPTARYWLAATTGPDGLVYALGGLDKHNTFATVEAYNPATDTWATRAPMPTARQGLAAVTGPDGLIYAIGGFSSPNLLATVETYDPATDTWTPRAPLPSATVWLAAAVGPNGLIYAIGGVDDGNNNVTARVYSYDPAAPAAGWANRAQLATARADLAAATGPDGLVYAIGGSAGQAAGYAAFDTVEAYTFDPNDGATHQIPDGLKKKEIYGTPLGGIDVGAGGGVVIGNHFIPIPPHSPAMSAILDAAAPHAGGAFEHAGLGPLIQQLRPAGS